MGIVLGLGAALAWSLGDFSARFAARQIGNFRTLLYMQLIGLVGLSLWMFLVQFPRNWDWTLLGLTAGLAIGNTAAGLTLYRAFEVGVLSVVSPIASSYGAITLLLGLVTGQRPSLVQLLGLALTILGVVLASAPLNRNRPKKPVGFVKPGLTNNGVAMAVVASLCFGVTFWGLGYVSPTLGGTLPVWVNRVIGPLVVLALARPLRQSVGPPVGRVWVLIGAVGVLDTVAFLLFNFGLEQADSSIVSVLSSLFSAITVLLARLFLKEKLVFNQWLGIGLIFVGVGSISAG